MTEDRPVRVGLLLTGSEGYGVASFLETLLRSVDRRKARLVGLFLDDPGRTPALAELVDECHALGAGGRDIWMTADWTSLASRLRNTPWMARVVARTVRAVRHLRLDVVHIQTYPWQLLGGVACRLAGSACLWHMHGPYRRSGLAGMTYRLGCALLADRVPCVSRFVRETMPSPLGGKCELVYNGIDAQLIAARQKPGALRRLLGISAATPLVVLLGAVVPRKGHEFFIRAAQRVLAQLPDVRFAIIGGEVDLTGHLARMKDLVGQLHLTEHVLFTGELPNASDYLCDASVLCMPTIPLRLDAGEAFGLVLIEAMAAGVSPIATACGASPEIITDGINGLLVPPKDHDALAAAILRLLQDPVLREAIGQAARQTVAEQFSAKQMASSMEDLYCRCQRLP